MSDALTDKVTARLEQLKNDIVSAIQSNGITASGRTQRSIEVEQYEGGVRLVAKAGDRAPIPTLEIGREGGRVPAGFTAILEQWTRDKGISFQSESRRRSFAYLLGRKIAREGTQRHKQPVDVYSTLTQQAAEDIRNIITAEVTEVIKNNF